MLQETDFNSPTGFPELWKRKFFFSEVAIMPIGDNVWLKLNQNQNTFIVQIASQILGLAKPFLMHFPF
jgi:hypothetical protein